MSQVYNIFIYSAASSNTLNLRSRDSIRPEEKARYVPRPDGNPPGQVHPSRFRPHLVLRNQVTSNLTGYTIAMIGHEVGLLFHHSVVFEEGFRVQRYRSSKQLCRTSDTHPKICVVLYSVKLVCPHGLVEIARSVLIRVCAWKNFVSAKCT